MDEAWTQAWAIGWYAFRKDDVVWLMHSGGHYGYITNACFDPKEKVGAIALLNASDWRRNWPWSPGPSPGRP